MSEIGPVYGVQLIDTLPLGKGGWLQQMPGRDDLEQVQKRNERVVAGYEVLLGHYSALIDDLPSKVEMQALELAFEYRLAHLKETQQDGEAAILKATIAKLRRLIGEG